MEKLLAQPHAEESPPKAWGKGEPNAEQRRDRFAKAAEGSELNGWENL